MGVATVCDSSAQKYKVGLGGRGGGSGEIKRLVYTWAYLPMPLETQQLC